MTKTSEISYSKLALKQISEQANKRSMRNEREREKEKERNRNLTKQKKEERKKEMEKEREKVENFSHLF